MRQTSCAWSRVVAYARVLQALGLEGDLEHLANDDVLGRKLQDAALGERARAPRRRRERAP